MPAWSHKSSWMPTYNPSIEELDAYLWCIRNNIKIAPEAILGDKKHYKIAINTGDAWNTSPPYDKDIIWSKLYEFCKYYKNKE